MAIQLPSFHKSSESCYGFFNITHTERGMTVEMQDIEICALHVYHPCFHRRNLHYTIISFANFGLQYDFQREDSETEIPVTEDNISHYRHMASYTVSLHCDMPYWYEYCMYTYFSGISADASVLNHDYT